MEALGAAASVIAVIQITASVLSACNDYLSSAKTASKEAEQIVSELTSLRLVLEQILLVAQREEQSRPNEPFSLAKLVAPGGELDTCKQNLTELQQKLKPQEGWKALKRALTWHFKEGEFRKTLERISKSKDTLNLAVTVDSALTSLNIQDEVINLAASFKAVTLNAIHQSSLNWLAAPDISENQNAARHKHQPATGTWFIDGQPFAIWKARAKSLLWLHGILDDHRQLHPGTALAYFYFDFNNDKKSTLSNLLRSLITQLATQNTGALTILNKEYFEHENGRRQPSLPVLASLLTSIIGIYADTYVVIDALDECKERDNLLDWIAEITELDLLNLHLLVLSREEKDIADVLNPLVDTQIPVISTNVDPDIRLYLRERLARDRKLKKWSIEVKDEIEQSLMGKVNGMFRLADCQMDMLCKCNNVVMLRKELQSLPKTLEATYNRILSEIDESHVDDALKVLQWLCFSSRPLLLTEMVEVLAVDNRETYKFNPDLRYADNQDILTICSSLISAHPRTIKRDPWNDKKEQVEELRLAHFSVKEYLISERLMRDSLSFFHVEEGLASAVMAESCIIYLMQFREYAYLNESNITTYPLATYAAKYWPVHAKIAQRKRLPSRFSNLVVDFLSDYEVCRNWISLFNPDERVTIQSDLEYIDLQHPIKDREIHKPLYYTCLFGLLDVTKLILANLGSEQDYGETGGEIGTVLHAAAYSGEISIIDLLLQKGVDINATDGEWGTPLGSAIAAGYEETALALLKKGADPNVIGGFYGTAIQAASYKGYYQIVSVLLDHGARLDAMGGQYGSALAAAAEGKYEAIVELLLDHGADINAQTTQSDSALHYASGQGLLKTVRLLIAKGAYINIQDGLGDTPLLKATRGNHDDTIQFLLERGADPNIGTPLSVASGNGNIKAVHLLLKYHADINQKYEGYYGTPLAEAASQGRTDIVDILLQYGADAKTSSVIQAAMSSKHLDIVQKLIDHGGANIHEYGGEYGYPLQSAALHNDLQMVRFLIDNGADVNARGGLYGTALQAAATNKAIVQYLIGHSADVNIQGGIFGSALKAAASDEWDHTFTTDLLIQHGADVNARDWDRRECTALHTAVEAGNTKIVKKLIKAGADIEARVENQVTPLHIAICNERAWLAEILLASGASMNSRNQENNDLHEAASNGLTGLVSKLLDKGADINGTSRYQGTALQASAEYGHDETIALLLERGADINACGNNDSPAVHLASASESLRALQLLVSAGADVHQKVGRYHTTLQAAASRGEFKNVEYLLGLHVDVNAEGGEYGTALQAAAYGENRNVVKLLLEAGAKVNIQGGQYGTALQAAAQQFDGSYAILKLLLDAGADVNLTGGEYGQPLQAAAQADNLEMVKTLIKLGANVNAKGGRYGTALFGAAQGGYTRVFDYLIANGADVNISGPDGTMLYYAAEGGSEEIIKTVPEQGVDINSGWGSSGSALGRAIDANSRKALKFLISRGIEINEKCGSHSALLQAIRSCEEENVKILLAAGVDVNAQIPDEYNWEPAEEWRVKDEDTTDDPVDSDNNETDTWTAEELLQDVKEEGKVEDESDKDGEIEYVNALHQALCGDNEDIKKLILSKVNNVNAIGGEYGNALQAALVHCHISTVQQLLSRGADVHARGGKFHTAIQAASTTDELARIQLLLAHDPTIDINAQGGEYNTALQAACYKGSLHVVKYLLDHGAHINTHAAGEKVGHFTALQAACAQGHVKVVKHLLNHGADINMHSPYYGDALQAASAEGQVEAVRLLLRRNPKPRVNINTCSVKYGNALQAATDGGYMKVIKLLILWYPCFQKGEMLEKAVESLRPDGHVNMAKEMERIAEEELLFEDLWAGFVSNQGKKKDT